MLHSALGIAFMLATMPAAAAGEALLAFGNGRPHVYLEVSEAQAHSLGISSAVGDFQRCFALMTGAKLRRSGSKVMLFDPASSGTTRFECQVTKMADASAMSSVNAQAGIVLAMTRYFPINPFAGPGEKVGWSCTWHRTGRLTFTLRVANQPYYGPGYGPFQFAKLEAQAPDFETGGFLRLAIEMTSRKNGLLRAGYAIGEGNWAYTDWVAPAAAGTDTSVPGKSDKKGPQGWKPDWPKRWAHSTAFFLTAYAPKGRKGRVTFASAKVTRSEKMIFTSDFSGNRTPAGTNPQWVVTPGQGKAVFRNGSASLYPASDGWNTVGLRAQVAGPTRNTGAIPLRAELVPMPKGASRYDARIAQGFEINATGKSIRINAHTSLGLQNAFYYLLDRWGCRWVIPGPLGECIPHRERLAIPEGITRFCPFSDTAVEPSSLPWSRRNMGGYDHWISGQHYWLYAIPPAKHFAKHPEWFSLLGGQRRARQLCTTNPEVIAEMIRKAKEYLRGSPKRMSFPMDPMDNIDFCECDRCRAQDPPGVMTSGVRSMTDRVLRFVNAVAAGIRDEFPDRYVAFYSYATHSDLPVNVRPARNVIVGVCRSHRCLLHLVPTSDCPTSEFHSFLKKWRKLTPNIYGYEYDPIYWVGGLPCPTYMEIVQSLKTQLQDGSIRGSYSDGGSRYVRFASTYINLYMQRRLKVDPTREPAEILSDMCRSFFGPAVRPMEQYYLELAKAAEFKHPGRTRVGGGSTYYHEMFRPAVVARARQFLNRGLELAAGKKPFQERTEMVDLSQQYLEAYLDGVWSAQKHQFKAAVAGFDRMDAMIDELDSKGFLDGEDAHRRARTMRLKTLAQHFPEEMGFVSQWELLGPFDNSARDAHLRQDPFEPIGALNKSEALADGTRAAWWEYESPGGFLNLEKAFAGKTGDWRLSYAYARTTFKIKKHFRRQLRMDSFHPFRVYLNGKEVYSRLGLDADCPDKRSVDVTLKPGRNVVVFKLSQMAITTDTFPWGLYFRVVRDEKREDAASFPERWAFRKDPKDVGEKERWYAETVDDSAWLRIKVPSAWEQTEVGAYDGTAWYRVKFTLPAKLKGASLALKFRGVDEEAWVYLNGKLIGERTTASTGKTIGDIWDKPFEIAVPRGRIRYRAPNLLAIKVHDAKYAGGIHKSVRLLVDR